MDGEQYVAVVAGFGRTSNYYAPNYSRLLVFKLGGTAQPPEPEPVLNPPPAFGTPEVIARGEPEAVRAYIVSKAIEAKEGETPAAPPPSGGHGD